jgi:2,3-diketo-5-methylthio-1-phosphopentane phosphatase
MKNNHDFFITIDFDGTVSQTDVTDAVIREFAQDGWQEAEARWERGDIGSRECLAYQMSLIRMPLKRILDYAQNIPIDPYFANFIGFLQQHNLPFAIISDGFLPIIHSILHFNGMHRLPVYAGDLVFDRHGLHTIFTNAVESCPSGTCKCQIAERLSKSTSLIHIGDGRSDFCLAKKAHHVFCKGRLLEFCTQNGISHSGFEDFRDIERHIKTMLQAHTFYIMPDLQGKYGKYKEQPLPWNTTI